MVEWTEYPSYEAGIVTLQGKLLNDAVFAHPTAAPRRGGGIYPNFRMRFASGRRYLGAILPPGSDLPLSGWPSYPLDVLADSYHLDGQSFSLSFAFPGGLEYPPSDYVVTVYGFQDASRTPTLNAYPDSGQFTDLLGHARLRMVSPVAETSEREGASGPRVRVVYAVPSDREIKEEYGPALREAALHVQRWYAAKLGGLTFELSASIPEICSLPEPANHYERERGWNRIIRDLQPCAPVGYNSPNYVWAVYPDVPFDCERSELGRGGAGLTILHTSDLEGVLAGTTQCGIYRDKLGYFGGLAHEIGHAFGLSHPPGCDEGLETCDRDAMMHSGYARYPYTYLTEADVETLMESPFIHRILEVDGDSGSR